MRTRAYLNVDDDGQVIPDKEAEMVKLKKAKTKDAEVSKDVKALPGGGNKPAPSMKVGDERVQLHDGTLVLMGLGTEKVEVGVLEDVVEGDRVIKRVIGVPLEGPDLGALFREAKALYRAGVKPEADSDGVVEGRKLGS